DQENQTTSVTFILLASQNIRTSSAPVLLFLTTFSVTVLGNLGMIAIIRVNTQLRNTPMYFFLAHLTFVDFCYSTAVTKLLENLLVKTEPSPSQAVSCSSCTTCVVTETYTLAVMAYDRFVAVCDPLRCTVFHVPQTVLHFSGASYSWGLICSTRLLTI
ncbi:hypothetical protein U0070_027536, partial [Myodes glareolus]